MRKVNVLFKRTFGFTILILRLLGMFPFWYNKPEKRFHLSNPLIAYSVVVCSLYVYFIGVFYWTTVQFVRIYRSHYNVYLLGAAFGTAYATVIVVNLTSVVFARRVLRLLNDCHRLWDQLQVKSVVEDQDKKLVYRFMFKMIVVDGLTIIGGAGIRLIQAIRSKSMSLFYEAVAHGFTYILHACTTNLFIGMAYFGGHFFRLINCRIRLLHRRISHLEQQEHHSKPNVQKKQQIYNNTLDELNRLVRYHEKVNRTILSFMQVHDASLLMMTLKNFVVTTTGVYLTYVATVFALHRNQVPSFGTYGFVTFFALFHFSQFYYQTASTMIFTMRVSLNLSITESY
ncbi:uncharacterized protein LOC109421707 [Aedes albopictus]|uniref:Gustatory receptor n=1 Tax=Aedes albopictus TaxID=7160 RepID=A0ABM2A3G4_AEDAL